MSEFVCDPKAGPYVYDLIAVSNHYGGMGGGHCEYFSKVYLFTYLVTGLPNGGHVMLGGFAFSGRVFGVSDSVVSTLTGMCILSLCATDTAYAKNKIDGKWYYFDDSSVSSATEDQIVVSKNWKKHVYLYIGCP